VRELGPLETVGAWLRIWTPPRDAVVPPVPWRKLALGALVVAVVVAGAAAIIGPAVDEGKQRGAERARRDLAERRQAATARLRADQRPHAERGTPVPARAPATEARRARLELRRDLERSIARDARARVSSGVIAGPILRAECEPVAREEADLSRTSGLYKCLAVRGRGSRSATGVDTVHGYPFVATIQYPRGVYTWCKTNPIAGEKTGRAFVHVRLSRSCAGRLADVL
jgi:hypothetical protein